MVNCILIFDDLPQYPQYEDTVEPMTLGSSCFPRLVDPFPRLSRSFVLLYVFVSYIFPLFLQQILRSGDDMKDKRGQQSVRAEAGLTPRLCMSQNEVVAKSKPMEKVNAARKTPLTKIEFRLNNVL